MCDKKKIAAAMRAVCGAGSFAAFLFAFWYRGGLFVRGLSSFVVDWHTEALGLKLAAVALGTVLLLIATDSGGSHDGHDGGEE